MSVFKRVDYVSDTVIFVKTVVRNVLALSRQEKEKPLLFRFNPRLVEDDFVPITFDQLTAEELELILKQTFYTDQITAEKYGLIDLKEVGSKEIVVLFPTDYPEVECVQISRRNLYSCLHRLPELQIATEMRKFSKELLAQIDEMIYYIASNGFNGGLLEICLMFYIYRYKTADKFQKRYSELLILLKSIGLIL